MSQPQARPVNLADFQAQEGEQSPEQKAALGALVQGGITNLAPIVAELMPRIIEFADVTHSGSEVQILRGATNLNVALCGALGAVYAKGFSDASPALFQSFDALAFFKENIDAMLAAAKPQMDAVILNELEQAQ